MTDWFDAIVMGAGPAGSSAAILLARAGWSVALVERKTFPRAKVCGEYLSATNLPLFERLGLAERFRDAAGPAVTQVGLFAGSIQVQAELPRPDNKHANWGHALAREHLDTWLRNEAGAHGVCVFQPWDGKELMAKGDGYHCRLSRPDDLQTKFLAAPVIIAAHGSWDPGTLPTQFARHRLAAHDLLAFKAHFTNADLPKGLMPLLAFPGGYGGMVHCEAGKISLSCCIRRDQLMHIRRGVSGEAGEAVLGHIQESCLAVRRVLRGARRQGPWLAAGPIRPGIRLKARRGLFAVGNAAGESHPVIAEGISMALQSSWLLTRRLIAWKARGGARAELIAVHNHYAADWKRSFAARLWASQVIARWAMSGPFVGLSLPLLSLSPALLTWGARLSGKNTFVVHSGS